VVWPLLCRGGRGKEKYYEEVQNHLLTSSAHPTNVLSHRDNNFLQSEFLGIGRKPKSPRSFQGFDVSKKKNTRRSARNGRGKT
jgi:hypothetical protein